MNVLIAIPAFNEEKNIAKVIEMIRQESPDMDYVVVSDGSTDKTANICKELDCPVIELPVNLGLGGAFGCAMKYANRKGYDALIQIDGDAQHNPNYINDLVAKMVSTNVDVVIGSRFCEKSAPYTTLRGFGSHIITTLIRIKTHKTIHDPTSGMRVYNNKVIKLFVNNDFMEPEPHTIAFLLKNGFSVEEVPVKMNERLEGKSYLGGFKAMRYMARVCTSILLV